METILPGEVSRFSDQAANRSKKVEINVKMHAQTNMIKIIHKDIKLHSYIYTHMHTYIITFCLIQIIQKKIFANPSNSTLDFAYFSEDCSISLAFTSLLLGSYRNDLFVVRDETLLAYSTYKSYNWRWLAYQRKINDHKHTFVHMHIHTYMHKYVLLLLFYIYIYTYSILWFMTECYTDQNYWNKRRKY